MTFVGLGELMVYFGGSGLRYVSYNVVPPPHTGRFSPPRIDLSYTGLPEFDEPSVKSYGVTPVEVVTHTSSVKISASVNENTGAPLIEDWESNEEDEVESPPKKERKNVEPSVNKVDVEIPKQNEKPTRRPVKYTEMYRTQRPRGNQRNWNNLKSHQLGSNFVMYNKACYVCGSFNHLQARCKYHQRERMGHSHKQIEDQGYFDSGCSRYITCNISYLTDFKEFDRGYVAFGGGAKGGKITGKGTIRTGKPGFEDVYFVKELQFNLFSVSQTCDKKNSVLYTDTECFVLSHDFSLADESHVLLKVPGKNNMYSVDMKNIVPNKDLTCLVAKATNDESMLWHMRLATKDETSRILKSFITEIENLVDRKVKIIRCDNGTKFKNRVMNKFYEEKGKGESFDACQSSMEEGPSKDYILMPLWNDGSLFDSSPKDSDGENLDTDALSTESKIDNPERPNDGNSTKDINTVRPSTNTASLNINTTSPTVNTVRLSDDYFGAHNDMKSLDGVELDISNLSTTNHVPATLNTKINKDHSLDNVIGDMQAGVRTRRMTVTTDEQGFISAIYEEKNHMDIKSAFLYGMIEEEVNVCQPSGFEDPNYPDKVYKVEKALYGLHQALRAWYETMAKYLLDNRFRRGKIDQTLFIKRQKEDILLVQVYVDDIIFGSTKKELCTEFEVLMHDKFQMSSLGELTFFLGLQVKQKSHGIFISQDKYIDEILRKFKYKDVQPASTPMDKEKALLKDSDGDDVDVHLYMSMIGSLMYLTSSRPDIMFV
nr:putative ribonuclease H-like domain-containing protein [Tanacetum cinerariifolium]